MFKQLLNECVITLHIKPDGPILIKSGIATVTGPDMAFVQVFRNGEWQPYLPGSSLKGVLRSQAERIARTLKSGSACNPFLKDGADISCGNRLEQEDKRRKASHQNALTSAESYGRMCPTCRLFGSLYYAGRLATTDAYAVGPVPRPQPRDGVGIDRLTGGSYQGAKFDLEVIVGGTFEAKLNIRNYELWQLGLVGFLIQDLTDGLIRIGSGKSRGLGSVVGEVKRVEVHMIGPRAPKPADGKLALKGVGALFDGAAEYRMANEPEVSAPFAGQPGGNAVRAVYTFENTAFPWADLGQRWVDYIAHYQRT
jgi:CRISPR-associated RAMP protein (TIGR02581 family)